MVNVELNSLDPALQARISQLKKGQWSEPFEFGGLILAVAVTETTPAQAKPLADVKPRIENQLMQRGDYQGAIKALEQEMLTKAKYEPVLK